MQCINWSIISIVRSTHLHMHVITHMYIITQGWNVCARACKIFALVPIWQLVHDTCNALLEEWGKWHKKWWREWFDIVEKWQIRFADHLSFDGNENCAENRKRYSKREGRGWHLAHYVHQVCYRECNSPISWTRT